VIAAVSVLYVARLDYSPVYLLNDEVFNALQAWSLVQTGRSAAGDYLPVYFRGLEFPPGRDPLCVYGTAAALTLLPLGDIALRLPTAFIGIVDIVLAYFVGKRLWASRRVGFVAALLLATAPAHFIHSRIAIPTLWSMPWLLAWLLALATYGERRDPKLLFIASAALGGAVYGYFGTAVIVPFLVIATFFYVNATLHVRAAKPFIAAGAGLLTSMALVLYWHILHPERWSELFSYYVTGPTILRSGTPLFVSGGPNFAGIQERVSAYWNYFDPTLLFLRGDASPRYSTGRAGVFLLPAAVFLPLGIYAAARARGLGLVLLFGFFTAPFAGAFANDVQIQRALPLVLFGALLSTWGVVWMWSHPSPRMRNAAAALSIVGLMQFGYFVVDYFGAYRFRSGPSRGGNLQGAMATAAGQARASNSPKIYLDEKIDNARYYWQFYAIVLGADDLSRRVETTSLADVLDTAPVGSLLITAAEDPRLDSRAAAGEWQLRSRVLEPDGSAFYTVLQRVR
jgi:4-amino-4-deoxy-L-arabinose transferase-like glycosyltransferase